MADKYTIKTLAELKALSKEILKISKGRRILIFKGDLGAGKTSLIQDLVEEMGSRDKASSPTFSIVNVYSGPIYHFDLYRIKTIEELEEIGFFEYLDSGNYCLIEWPEIVEEYLDLPYVEINISINENNTRNVLILSS